MIAVIFGIEAAEGQEHVYLETAAVLLPLLQSIEGFISVERFRSLTNPGKLLSLSFFENEEAVKQWRNTEAHRLAQAKGRGGVFAGYRLRVAHVLRDYGLSERDAAPEDSRRVHNA